MKGIRHLINRPVNRGSKLGFLTKIRVPLSMALPRQTAIGYKVMLCPTKFYRSWVAIVHSVGFTTKNLM